MSTSENVVPVLDTVYCIVHGAVHENYSDPYSDGTACGSADWCRVYRATVNLLEG